MAQVRSANTHLILTALGNLARANYLLKLGSQGRIRHFFDDDISTMAGDYALPRAQVERLCTEATYGLIPFRLYSDPHWTRLQFQLVDREVESALLRLQMLLMLTSPEGEQGRVRGYLARLGTQVRVYTALSRVDSPMAEG
ncbi:hypothetical protein LTR56_019422 [Elasticomyces elasticus]|nr:hypothetical protein LTR56_019422 [Elasticomyces elasticus]KAK3635878.1 hypothetical protein LTR22_019013 [Elasticomyces elasticus]KAK4907318.1 hypothetical protein LTR49_023644 [Elasticomyces elasticus]KAK5747756.1 hypothetical protein LTS12_022198 [Elasticomyces elasticus]